MNSRKLAFAVGVLFAACGSAPPVSAQESATSTKTGESAWSLAAGTTIPVQLSSTIDTKKAKVGDTVVAQTTSALKSTDDRTILPQGTKVVGKITQSSARSASAADSALAIRFDKALLKDNQEVMLNVIIQAVAAPAGSSVVDSQMPAQLDSGSGRPPGASSNSSMSGSRGARPDTNAGYPSSYPTTNGSGSDSLGGQAGTPNPAEQLDAESRGVLGLKGLKLEQAPSDTGQVSVIHSDGKSVHLSSGTRFILMTQTVSAGGSAPSLH